MSRRTEKVARSLQVHLAELVNYHLGDPRIDRMVTISAVEVSADLSYARVRVTALGATDAQMRTLVRALEHASGRLRNMLADRVDLRVLPRLDFRVDEQTIRARRTLETIEQLGLSAPGGADGQPGDEPEGDPGRPGPKEEPIP